MRASGDADMWGSWNAGVMECGHAGMRALGERAIEDDGTPAWDTNILALGSLGHKNITPSLQTRYNCAPTQAHRDTSTFSSHLANLLALAQRLRHNGLMAE